MDFVVNYCADWLVFVMDKECGTLTYEVNCLFLIINQLDALISQKFIFEMKLYMF
jgi:hypothetical protein